MTLKGYSQGISPPNTFIPVEVLFSISAQFVNGPVRVRPYIPPSSSEWNGRRPSGSDRMNVQLPVTRFAIRLSFVKLSSFVASSFGGRRGSAAAAVIACHSRFIPSSPLTICNSLRGEAAAAAANDAAEICLTLVDVDRSRNVPLKKVGEPLRARDLCFPPRSRPGWICEIRIRSSCFHLTQDMCDKMFDLGRCLVSSLLK